MWMYYLDIVGELSGILPPPPALRLARLRWGGGDLLSWFFGAEQRQKTTENTSPFPEGGAGGGG